MLVHKWLGLDFLSSIYLLSFSPHPGENNTDLGEFSSSCAPSTSLSMGQQLEKKSNDYRDNKIAQMRKEYAGSITPSKELDAQTSRGQGWPPFFDYLSCTKLM